MAGEAISSSILLIGAAVGAAFLIAAILPAIFSAGDTFGTVAHSAENKMKTDFRIVNTYAEVSGSNIDLVQVWMKNVGANPISIYDIAKSDVFFGKTSSIVHYTNITSPKFEYYTTTSNNYWNIGDTLEIKLTPSSTISKDDVMSFTFTLPNSVRRTTSFTANI
jgi:archaeal flagellar protein FlaG